MIKQALIEFVRTAILKSEAVADNQKTVHYKRVEQAVNYAFDTVLSQIKLDEEGLSDIENYYVKSYFNQPVLEANGYRYVAIGDNLATVGNGKGVWYVQPAGGGKPFAKSARPRIALFRSLKVGERMAETYWRLGNLGDNLQIVLENIGNSPFADIRKVDYGIVRSLASYADDEEVRVPDGRFDLVVQMALTWFGERYLDKSNNNQ